MLEYLTNQIHANRPRVPFLASQSKRTGHCHSIQKGGRVGGENHPSGGQYCRRIYTIDQRHFYAVGSGGPFGRLQKESGLCQPRLLAAADALSPLHQPTFEDRRKADAAFFKRADLYARKSAT